MADKEPGYVFILTNPPKGRLGEDWQEQCIESGVCQSPKYFSKGGVSLYKLKDSFLGGKKK